LSGRRRWRRRGCFLLLLFALLATALAGRVLVRVAALLFRLVLGLVLSALLLLASLARFFLASDLALLALLALPVLGLVVVVFDVLRRLLVARASCCFVQIGAVVLS
jgi:hypothetical protein